MASVDPAGDQRLSVEVVYCPAPHSIDRVELRLSVPATALEAVRASGLLERHGLPADALELGIWGRVCAADQPLRDRDRVEVYRPLTVDPKEARRMRYKGRRQDAGGSRRQRRVSGTRRR